MSRRVLVTAPHEATVEEGAIPKARPDGVVVAIRYCGICATDTHGYESGGLIPPSVFGHEWTGTIVEVGEDVSHLAVGQRVVAGVGPACGRCAMCRGGVPEHCDLAFAEANGVTEDAPAWGGFSDHVAVSARRVVPALEGLTDEQAGLVEPTTVTFHAVRRARQELGALVVVQGAGPIGLLTAQHARHAGAGRVLIVEPSPERRSTATQLGFTEVFEPGDAFRSYLQDQTDGRGADVVYECAGVASLFQPSAELVRRGGTLALLGYPMTTSEVSYGDWQSRELTVIGSLAYTHSDFVGAMRAIVDGSVNVDVLHTATIGLEELPTTLARLAAGDTSNAKILVDPTR